MNEWLLHWISQRRFSNTWSPSLFLIGRWVIVYLATFIFSMTTFCFSMFVCELILSASICLPSSIKTNADDIRQIHPGWTSGINNGGNVEVKSSMIRKWTRTIWFKWMIYHRGIYVCRSLFFHFLVFHLVIALSVLWYLQTLLVQFFFYQRQFSITQRGK